MACWKTLENGMCVSNAITKGGLEHVAAHTTVVHSRQTNGIKCNQVEDKFL